MNILLLSFYYVPDIGPDPPLMSSLAEGWLAHGHQVTVVCSFPHYQRTALAPRYRWRLFEVERAAPGYRIVRCRVSVPRTGALWRRALNYLSFLATGLLAILAAGRHDVVFACTPPPTVGVLAVVARWLWRAPLIDNVQDIYPDVAVKLGLLRRRWLVRAILRCEQLVYRASAAVCVISEGARANLQAKGVPAEKLHCIPNWVDTDAITPQPRDNLLARQRGWVGACIVMYSGNVGHSQGLGVLLDIAPQLGGVRLVIVGQGAGHRALQGAARTRALGNVEFHGFAERAELPLLLAAADVSLVMMRPELSVESVPSKLYAIMSSARPVLLVGSPDSDAWRLVARARAGVCVRHGDQAALVRAVMQLRDDPDLCARLGANGRWYAVEHGSRKAGVQRYTSLVASLRVADVCSSWPSGTCER